jgi:hypothetical protein
VDHSIYRIWAWGQALLVYVPEIPDFTSTQAILSRSSVNLNTDFVICRVLIIVALFIEYKIFYKFRLILVGKKNNVMPTITDLRLTPDKLKT